MLLDTHREYKTLMGKGFNDKQAEAIAELISRRNDDLATKSDLALVKKDVEYIKEQMATKSDIKDLKIDMANLRSELKSDISNLRSELKDDISDLKDDIAHFKSDIIKWIVGTQMSTLAIVIAIIAFLK